MSDDTEFQTSPTLLGQLRSQSPDDAAWNRFESRYAPLVASWCRRWGLQASDAEDISQEVLLALSKQLASFQYDPGLRFRGLLHTIARRAWYDLLAKRKREAVSMGDTAIVDVLERQADGDAFAEQLEAEWQRELLELAMRRVKERVEERTWLAFEALTREGRSGAEVAEMLDMKVGAVWVAKSKVKKMLGDEVALLEAAEFHPGGQP